MFRARNQNGAYAIKAFVPGKEENDPHVEGSILARLNHPGIPRFIEVFEHEGVEYLVQEYIEGYPLSYHVVKGRRFTEDEAKDILCQLLEVLMYIHGPEEGRLPVVHRDIRLSNLVWNDGRVHLIDFGLARHWDGVRESPGELPGEMGARMSRCRPGTKTYATFRKEVSPRSDLFGVGVVGLDLFTAWIDDEGLFQEPWQDILPASDSYKDFLEKLLGREKRFKTAEDAWRVIRARMKPALPGVSDCLETE